MPKIYVHPCGDYSLTLPDDWENESQRLSVDFFQPENGLGGINIGVMTPGPFSDPAELLLRFGPESIRPGVQTWHLTTPYRGAYVEYEAHGDMWRAWALYGPKYVLMISYHCEASSIGVEDAVVDQIIGSAVIR